MLEVLDEGNATTGADFGSLHTAYSTSGANEVTGGSPAYARVALTWSAAASGSKALAATLPTWNVPASTTVGWWGGWTASTAGTFCFMMPVGAGTLRGVSADSSNVTANTFYSEAHGYSADNRVVFWGAGLPTGVTVGTIYYVIATGLTADEFSVSTTSGGSAVDITDDGIGFVQICVPETFTGQGTYSLSSASIDLSAVA